MVKRCESCIFQYHFSMTSVSSPPLCRVCGGCYFLIFRHLPQSLRAVWFIEVAANRRPRFHFSKHAFYTPLIMLAGLLMGTWLGTLFESLAANRANQLALINAGALRRTIFSSMRILVCVNPPTHGTRVQACKSSQLSISYNPIVQPLSHYPIIL